MQTVLEKKVFLINTLSADASFILQYAQQDKIITMREYRNLNHSNHTQEKIVTNLLDTVMNKGDATCRKFVDLLQLEDIQASFPELQQLFIPAPTSRNQENPVKAADEKMSIAETHPQFSTGTGSLSRSESTMDTDSRGRPVSRTAAIDEDDYYPMTQRPLGHCLIINNYNFEKTFKLNNRKGTDADKAALTNVFGRMHFSVEARRDLTSSDMLNAVKEFSEKDHSRMDAFVCCILSHGEKGTVLGTDGKSVLIRELTQPFARCSTLTGKPKLFFIQACQGNELQQGAWRQDGPEEAEYREDAGGEIEEDADKADPPRVPVEADFLIGMATVESYKSFRHTKEGSIFIQELCKHLKEGCPKNEDILSIMTKVNRSVSARELNKHKQMPEPRYTLTKKLLLPMD